MADKTDVDVSEHFNEDEAEEYGAEQEFGHFQLDGEQFVTFDESLGAKIGIDGVEHVIGYRVDTPLDEREKLQRAQQDDDIDTTEFDDMDDLLDEVDDRVTFGRVYHSNADGEQGVTLMAVETDDSLDEIIDKFTDPQEGTSEVTTSNSADPQEE